MTYEKIHTVVEKHEVANEELDEALFVMLNPTFDSKWTEVKKQEARELVRLAYKNGYRLRILKENKECEYYDSKAETCRRSESEFDELNNLYYGMTDSMQKAVKNVMLVANGKEIEE